MITWRDEGGGLHHGSLFGAFAALARGEAHSFAAARSHQREPFHAWTSQVAALALLQAGSSDLPEEEGAWRDLLLGLTPDHPDAWSLIVEDWTKPALLQPPVVSPANEAEYRNTLFTPDALDMLVTSKNHDVKQERIAEASEEDWLFALVTLQTTEGFLGAGNYGISRMNGGFASRMSLGVRPFGGGASGAFRRDVRRLVADARSRPDRRTGLALLWTRPWDGTESLDYTSLDELYVEICRRVRLQRGADGIHALAAGSKCARVAASELKGKTGDPWAPIKADGTSSHTPSGAGFGYRQMAQLFDTQKITTPLLAQLHEEDDPHGLSIVAAALVRGQGKTEGLHRRAIRTSIVKELEEYGPVVVLDRIGDVAKRRADEAGEASRRLRHALMLLVQGGPDKARLDDDAAARKVAPWVDRFEDMIDHGLNLSVDRDFFDADFWSEMAGDTGHRLAWRTRLRDTAMKVLDEAAEAAPRTAMRRIRAKARARTMLEGQMNKWIRELPDGE